MDLKVKLLPYQMDFIMATEPKEVLLLGGIGSGKSKILAIDMILTARKYPKIRMLLAANTYAQLMTATVKTLTDILDDFRIPYKSVLSGARKRIEFLQCTVYLYSLEKYDNIRGIEVGMVYLDEVCFSKVEALNAVRGRLRGKIGPRQIKMTSSPNGFNHMYDIFEGKDKTKFDEYNKPVPSFLIRALTQQNRFLPEGTFEYYLDVYGGPNTPLARQELFGEFTNLVGGQIYGGFDRKRHIKKLALNPLYPVYVGVDFNIDKMSATYVQYINGKFYQCKEVQLTHNNANTLDLGHRIIKDLQGFQVYIVPDSTGNTRKTSATSAATDHTVLKELGLNIMPTFNPQIRDRQNTVNYNFYKDLLEIDESCIETVKEIETLSNRDVEGKDRKSVV